MKNDIIKTLTTREQCRDRISVWYGSADNYQHGFREVMANACDEINNNFDKGIIEIELFEDLKTISVKDTGRGIPIEGKTDGKPNRVLLFETLFAGTNYENSKKGKITTGVNGVGTCTLNHTSTLFKVESYRGKKLHELIYENGGEFKSFKSYDNPLINEEYSTGTKITFKLDDEVYTKTEYVYDEIIDICDKIASVNPNIKFVIKHKDDIRNISYKSLQDYFINTMGNEQSFESVVKVFDKPEKNIYEIVLTGSLENNKQYTFLNGTYLPEQGSIYDGIINGIRLYSNNYFKSNNMYKSKEKNLTNKDVQGAVSFICKVESVNVSFSNQTKFSTAKKLYEELGKEYIQEMLEIWKNEEPMEFKRLMNIILASKRSNEKVQDYMSKTKKKLQETITVENRVDGYVDCKEYGEDSMLFVCEGRSALGSIVLARDAKNQAVFPLRGKILNILKSPYDKIFKNKEIEGLVKVLGCGVESKTTKIDFDKLRFGKLVIATDADCDGFHIQCLVLTMIYRLMPTLLERGHVYILDTPLFEIRDLKEDKMYYAYSDKEKDEIISKLNKYQVSRNKGLGELEPTTMSMCIKEGSNTIRQVQWEEIEEVNKWFETLMGEDLQTRKEYIKDNLHKYKMED